MKLRLRRLFFILHFSFFIFNSSQAQYVLIPDTNFRNFLMNNGFAACMQGDSLDTTCTAVVTAVSLNCSNHNINDITGVKYFHNLKILYCSNNNLLQIGVLPSLLTSLYCQSNNITSIQDLPDSLLSLDCSYNQIQSLPALPTDLKTLNCSYNQIQTLSQLPALLTNLSCSNNQLTALPVLPDSIISLSCNQNLLTSLPVLPQNLRTLSCTGNNLSTLPVMGDSLRILFCNNNQLVSIPNFSSSLNAIFCGYNQLTSIPALPDSLTELICNNNLLTSLPALPQPLINLFCWNNQLASLPNLTNSLVSIGCAGNQLTSLPNLPLSLEELTCGDNQLSGLPLLHDSLRYLECSNNQITVLPSLPAGLETLGCGLNLLTTLPSLPSGIFNLYCDRNQLTSIPALPDSLEYFSCRYNFLDTLPALPAKLGTLLCSFNHLTSLPSLPAALSEIYCSNNQITILPALPLNMLSLDCSYNPISSLPILPDTIQTLDIRNTQIECLGKLRSILYFYWDSTLITCLPEIGNVYDATPSLDNVPLCQPSSPCPAVWNIAGDVFLDSAGNCIRDINDIALNGIPVMLDSGGSTLQTFYTNGGGHYSFRTGIGNYEIRIDTAGIPFTVNCPVSFFNSSLLTPVDSLDSLVNFGLQCQNGYDLIAKSISTSRILRPGALTSFYLNAGDVAGFYGGFCTPGVNGSVKAIISDLLSYINPLPNALLPTSVIGDTITWNIGDFSVVDPESAFNFLGQVSTAATMNDSICIQLNVIPALDNNSSNNTLTECIPLSNSYDPNEKYMSPSGLVDTSSHWFAFTVFFQNTGTASAENIYILDTLHENLDPTTFTYIASSHEVITQLLPGNILRFNYPHINLPDSNTNEPASHGFVKYKVKRKDSMQLNESITNTAHIFFDFNAPVATNTVSATFASDVGVKAFFQNEVSIYPNPAGSQVTVDSKQIAIDALDVYDVVGSRMAIHPTKISKNKFLIDVSELQSGVYFLLLKNDSGISVKRFVKR